MNKRFVFGIGLLLCALFGYSILLTASEPEPAKLHHVSSEVCANCHAEIYRQWRGSMHAQSTALSDPIHEVFYRQEVGDPRQEGMKHLQSGTFPICLQCHAPNAAIDQTTKLDAHTAYSEGVNCVACHTLARFKGTQGDDGELLRVGMQAYERSEVLQGPLGMNNALADLLASSDDLFGGAGLAVSDSQRPNPHLGAPVTLDGKTIPALSMEGNPRLMKSSDICMGCHDQRNNPHGVPLCQTGDEFRASGSQVTCLSCHMPINAGLADHSMPGGHIPSMVARGVLFDVDVERAGDTLQTTVTLKNPLPHAMPTGAPFRNVYFKLMAYDSSGTLLWQNAEGHPSQDDPQAYLSYALADADGQPAPPPTATQPGDDTRLQPHEERNLVYEIPASGVVLVRGELYYNLLWPSLVERFSHLPKELTDPMQIAVAERLITSE